MLCEQSHRVWTTCLCVCLLCTERSMKPTCGMVGCHSTTQDLYSPSSLPPYSSCSISVCFRLCRCHFAIISLSLLLSLISVLLSYLTCVTSRHLYFWVEFRSQEPVRVSFSVCSCWFQKLLSTHADRQGVDISVTVCLFICLFVFCVCMVTDFSTEDKASDVKFFTVVYRRPGRGISHFGELSSPISPKSDESASHREVKLTVWRPTVNVTLEMRRSWNMARRVDVGRHVWI